MRLTAPIQISNLARMEVAAVTLESRPKPTGEEISERAAHALPSFSALHSLVPLYVPVRKSMTARLLLDKSHKNSLLLSPLFGHFPSLHL